MNASFQEQNARVMALSLPRRLPVVWLGLICLAALWPLLWQSHYEFGLDWPTHIYPIGYQAEYFRQHGCFSDTLTTDWVTGMPYPVFYAVILYPVAALLAVVIGADWAVRLLAVIALVAQIYHVWKLIRSAGGDTNCALLISALLGWATYALTNLYNRGAFSEYVAVALLTCAMACFLRVGQDAETRKPKHLLLQGSLFFVLSAGCHPITAFFGGLLLVALAASWHAPWWRIIASEKGLSALLTAIVLVPWVYVLVQFKGQLSVERDTMSQVSFFSETIDAPLNRIWPWPRDLRVTGSTSLNQISTPYLDAQLSVPLLLLALVGLVMVLRAWNTHLRPAGSRLLVVSWAIFICTFLLSTWSTPWEWLPAPFRSLQYAYRLVTYQNLALLMAIVGTLLALGPSGFRAFAQRRWPAAVILLLGLGSLGLKLNHALAAHRPPGAEAVQQKHDQAHFAHLPYSFYGWRAYAICGTNFTQKVAGKEAFLPVGTGNQFGKTGPLKFELNAPTYVNIHVQPFPWNRVFINGEPIDPAKALTRHEGYLVRLPEGTHEILYQWQPDPIWVWLRRLSWICLLGWAGAVIRLSFKKRFENQVAIGTEASSQKLLPVENA